MFSLRTQMFKNESGENGPLLKSKPKESQKDVFLNNDSNKA